MNDNLVLVEEIQSQLPIIDVDGEECAVVGYADPKQTETVY